MTVALAIFGPVLGFLGVVVGLWLGQRRWNAEQARKDADGARRNEELFIENERVAYMGLWDLTTQTEEQMRLARDGLTAQKFSGMLADLNDYMLRQGLYVERADRHLTIDYLFWVNEYFRVLALTTTGRVAIATTALHDGLYRNLSLLEGIIEKSNSRRSQLRDQIRAKIGAPPSNAWNDDIKPSAELLANLKKLHRALAADVSGLEMGDTGDRNFNSPFDPFPVRESRADFS